MGWDGMKAQNQEDRRSPRLICSVRRVEMLHSDDSSAVSQSLNMILHEKCVNQAG